MQTIQRIFQSVAEINKKIQVNKQNYVQSEFKLERTNIEEVEQIAKGLTSKINQSDYCNSEFGEMQLNI